MIIRESRWPASLAGSLLIADLDLLDPNFKKAVVLVIEHSEKGAFGLVLNKVSQLNANQLELDIVSQPTELIFNCGGPVNLSGLTCLNDGLPKEYQSFHAQSPVPGVVFEPAVNHVFQYMQDFPDQVNSKIRFFLGYSGWGPGQLEYEMEQGAWAYIPATPSIIFASTNVDIWLKSMRRRGGLYQIFAETGFKPSLN